MILSSNHYGAIKHVGSLANHMLSLVSPFCIAAMFGIAAVWAIEKAPSQTFVNTNVLDARTGSDLDINIPVIVHTEAKRAVYRMWIEDAQGSTVYQFPDQNLDDPRVVDLTNKKLLIPKSIRPGRYTLHVQVIYTFNPFKNGNIFMTVASLNVSN